MIISKEGNNVHASSGYQGMVGYRDGVLGSTLNEWHAGVFTAVIKRIVI